MGMASSASPELSFLDLGDALKDPNRGHMAHHSHPLGL